MDRSGPLPAPGNRMAACAGVHTVRAAAGSRLCAARSFTGFVAAGRAFSAGDELEPRRVPAGGGRVPGLDRACEPVGGGGGAHRLAADRGPGRARRHGVSQNRARSGHVAADLRRRSRGGRTVGCAVLRLQPERQWRVAPPDRRKLSGARFAGAAQHARRRRVCAECRNRRICDLFAVRGHRRGPEPERGAGRAVPRRWHLHQRGDGLQQPDHRRQPRQLQRLDRALQRQRRGGEPRALFPDGRRGKPPQVRVPGGDAPGGRPPAGVRHGRGGEGRGAARGLPPSLGR